MAEARIALIACSLTANHFIRTWLVYLFSSTSRRCSCSIFLVWIDNATLQGKVSTTANDRFRWQADMRLDPVVADMIVASVAGRLKICESAQ